MDKRYQIFVSSTFTDLEKERQAVAEALLSLDHFPTGMETFPASDDDALTLIKGVIDDSDYYVLVIGGRYGSTNEEGIGYTEIEFDYAVSRGIPVVAFFHQEPGSIPAGKTDQNDKLRERLMAFKAKVQKNHHVKFWKTADDLKAKVIQSISAETKRNPREGWVRASRVSDPAVTEQLRQEIDRLSRELDATRTSPPPEAGNYSGGSDIFSVSFEWGSAFYPEEREAGGADVEVSWDNIFNEVGPSLMEEATEERMKQRLGAELRLYTFGEPEIPADAYITDSDFETIKVQLFALGLIDKSVRKHAPSDRNKYWSLTPFGERKLLQMRAIKKKNALEKAEKIGIEI